jgi:outer membrane receptor for ferrienterochelin and colicins
MKRLFLMVVVAGLQVLFAQEYGTLEGQAVDARSGEKLLGVNILLESTVLGRITDLDGHFSIPRIPAGRYALRASMVGYKTLQQTGIVIQPGKTTRLQLRLESTLIETADVVVTASKRRQSIQESPTSVGVMTSHDLAQKNEIYLDKVLENASGVNFIGSQVNIRGSSGYNYGAGTRVLMLIDGVPILPGDSGDLKWDMVPTTQVERVEIIKGAGSALYGSSAMGGVINIITKSASIHPTTNIRLSAGVYDKPAYAEWRWTDRTLHYEDMDVDHSRRIGASQVLVAAGRHTSTGYIQNSDYERYNASLKWYTPVTAQSNLTFSTNYETGTRSTGLMWRSQRYALQVAPEAIDDYITSNKLSANAFYQWAVSKNFGLKSRLSYLRNYWKNYFHDNLNASTAQKLGLEIQGDYQFSNLNSLTFGTEESWDHVTSGLVGGHDQYGISAYVQNERKLPLSLAFTLGFRYDYQYVDNGFTDQKVSPKIGLVWQANHSVHMRASSGRGFRAASMSERFSDSIYSGLRLMPNPDLRSETAWSHEFGANFLLGSGVYLDLAGFSSDYWNLIEPLPDAAQTIRFINVTRARITGLESNLKFSPGIRHLTCDLGYTYMDPQDLDLHETLAYRPKHLLQSALTYQWKRMDVSADYRYVSRLEVVKLYPSDDRVAQKNINTHVGFKIGAWHVSAHVYNLFNHNHTQMERTLMPIRNYALTLRAMY